MKQSASLLGLLLLLLFAGCGDSRDQFVFTNSNNVTPNGPDDPDVGVPAQLEFVVLPSQTIETDFSVAPVVEVQDKFGDRVPGATNTITLSLVNPGTATLLGTTTRNAVDGRATFPGLSVSEPGTYQLTCSSEGLESDTSPPFTLAPTVALYGASLVSGNGANGDGYPTRLVELDPATGAFRGILGNIGNGIDFDFVTDIQCLPDGSIRALAYDDGDLVLVNVDPSDPESATVVGTIPEADYDTPYSLAYDSETDTLYALLRETASRDVVLVTLDPATAEPTLIGPTGDKIFNGNGLAYDVTTNTLYRTIGGTLYTIDRNTGAATLVGSGEFNSVKALDFHPLTNVLYAAGRGRDGANEDVSAFGTVDLSSGESTELGFAVDLSGMSFCVNPTVPTPGPVRQTGYSVEAIAQAFVDITATGTDQALGDDDWVTVPLGFTFNFNGTDYSSVQVASNGFITFSGTVNDTLNLDLLPSEQFETNGLAVWWDDLDPTEGGTIYTETRGTAPNRTFIAQWAQVDHNIGTAGGIDVEIILHEGSNVIEFHYDDVTFGNAEVDNGRSATVGIQIDEETADLWSVREPVLTDSTAIRFTPPVR